MEEPTRVASRRGLLGRGALLVAGAVGIVAARRQGPAEAAAPKTLPAVVEFKVLAYKPPVLRPMRWLSFT